MKKLSDILQGLKIIDIVGKTNIDINNIVFDSRKVKKNDIFVAIKGTFSNGHNYIKQAIQAGACAIIYSDKCPDYQDVTLIKVENTSDALSFVASNYYANPSKELTVIGVTGTNGKTTTATSLYHLFNNLGYKSGLISTIANYIGNEKIETKLTTPDAVELQRLFRLMVDADCDFCFMEVSSHAIAQKRIANIDFDGGIFTNITHEHLDFHKTFENYLKTKKSFFDNLKPDAFVLTNIDDKNGNFVVQNTKRKYTYSLKTIADFKAKIIEKHFDATLVEFNGKEIWLQFAGRFNVYNLLAVYAVASIVLQNKDNEILEAISALKPVDGRFDIVKGRGIVAIIDYAHTPDALENVLKELKNIKQPTQKLITVVGAGGDRDKEKRPKMAAISDFYSDILVLTSDNPRTENPEDILNDMQKGLDDDANFLKITDRREAIKTAVKLANSGDIILIAGKGHETYQEINGIRTHFDDKEEVAKILKK
jgi:UDP-N-acetylmuramoyl-L-alanyl-D-glutamate--2,6-diaminopimelate ligase